MNENDNEQGAGVTVAVEETLSAVAQLRMDLDTYDELFSTANAHMTDEEWRPFEAAQDKLYSAVDDNLHMLLDVIDAQAAELARLRAFVYDFADMGNNRHLNDKGIVFAYLDFQKTARKLIEDLAIAASEKGGQA